MVIVVVLVAIMMVMIIWTSGHLIGSLKLAIWEGQVLE